MTSVEVRVPGGRDYPVLVEPGGLDRLPELLARHAPAHRYALVVDAQVAGFHGDRVQRQVAEAGRPTSVVLVPPGEASKSRAAWARITDQLLAEGLGRDGCIVALGGGVVGDLAGFVAATFMRGIPVVQLPTSLVAMIDSAVGGKTGVDTPAGKNLVGAFHPPRFVLADPELALTLPPAERAQGLAEAVKHGAIVDRPYLERLEAEAAALLEGQVELTTWAVARSVAIKADVVSRDEREGGLREILNFGHTLGHALEACSDYTLPHGTAVARGMVLEARLGERLGVTEEGTAHRLGRALEAVGLPAGGELTASPAELLRMAHGDKKARGGVVRIVLLSRLGEVARFGTGGEWSHPVPDHEMEALLTDGGVGTGV